MRCTEEHTKQNSWWLNDCKGIPLKRVCDSCIEEVKKGYEPWVFGGYDQSDIDEPIEPLDGDYERDYSDLYDY